MAMDFSGARWVVVFCLGIIHSINKALGRQIFQLNLEKKFLIEWSKEGICHFKKSLPSYYDSYFISDCLSELCQDIIQGFQALDRAGLRVPALCFMLRQDFKVSSYNHPWKSIVKVPLWKATNSVSRLMLLLCLLALEMIVVSLVGH